MGIAVKGNHVEAIHALFTGNAPCVPADIVFGQINIVRFGVVTGFKIIVKREARMVR